MDNDVKIINKLGESIRVNIGNNSETIIITIDRPEDKVALSTLSPGDIFKVSDAEYIVLEQFKNSLAAAIRKEALKDSIIFDPDSNNWKTSILRKYLNSEYLDGITGAFGLGSIVDYDTDMLSLDGLRDYGKCIDKISLLNIDQYRKYRNSIGEPLSKPWWLVTPDSTPSGFPGNSMLYVGTSGDIGFQPCSFKGAVRPFIIARSDIYVTLVKQYGVDR